MWRNNRCNFISEISFEEAERGPGCSSCNTDLYHKMVKQDNTASVPAQTLLLIPVLHVVKPAHNKQDDPEPAKLLEPAEPLTVSGLFH